MPQPFRVDLEPGKEQEERQPREGEHSYRDVDRDEVEARRPDHDSEHDLEHDGRDARPRRQLDEQRRGYRDGRDREHIREREGGQHPDS